MFFQKSQKYFDFNQYYRLLITILSKFTHSSDFIVVGMKGVAILFSKLLFHV